jgi:hypothetical protein
VRPLGAGGRCGLYGQWWTLWTRRPIGTATVRERMGPEPNHCTSPFAQINASPSTTVKRKQFFIISAIAFVELDR